MKKLFAVLFCSFVMAGTTFAEELSYEIDPVATAQAPWKVGDRIIKKGECNGIEFYRKFLGVTQSELTNLALVQDFYLSGEKLSNPFLVYVRHAEKHADDSCLNALEGGYTQWYKDGQKQLQFNVKYGEIEGVLTVWYESGQKKREGSFKNNVKVGIWREWDEKGNLIREDDFGTPNA